MNTPKTILIADDNLTIQRMATEMLSGEGLEVVTVSNGMAAIKKIPTLMPLVVVADVDMPGKDGYEVCEFVKSQPALNHIRVVLVVSDTDPLDNQRGLHAQLDGVVKKPFDRQEFVSLVMKCAGQAEASRPAPPVAELPQPAEAAPWDDYLEPPPESAAVQQEAAGPVDPEKPLSSPPAVIFSEPGPAEPSTAFEDAAASPEGDWTVGISAPPEKSNDEAVFNHSDAELPAWAPDAGAPADSRTVFESQSTPPLPEAIADEEGGGGASAEEGDGLGTSAPKIDLSLVSSIVHRVVSRMAPPALSPESLAALERKLTDEIVTGLAADLP